MRWDNLKIAAEEDAEQARLPGYRDAAVIRRFDAPEALDTRFYEIHAKSALNRVPEKSYVPFRWTVNPYRGCSHACQYCLWGETPILMADGRTRAMGDLEVGDKIVGTVSEGKYRRYVETEVLDHWTTVKPAYRITLEDRTELISSGDHRFLTNRGWKYVSGAMSGPEQRPYLTLNNELLGTGRFAQPPRESRAYRRGYLCGLIRGDAHIASPLIERFGKPRSTSSTFRLALTDLDALRRAKRFLAATDVETRQFQFAAAAGSHREIQAIAASGRVHVDAIVEIIEWPLWPSDAWRKGFLAGMFDAEGSCGREALRIGNCDPVLLFWTKDCLRHFGFDAVEDRTYRPNGMTYIRIRGGLRERLRFFHMTDPAITRKRQVQGIALKSDAKTRVKSIEPLGVTLPMYDITTGTGDFISNGVVSHNCFARPTHTYLDFDAGRDFEKEIVVKVNVPEVLRAELKRPSWTREHVALGTNTDPYQWVEGRYKLMPGIWEAFRDTRTPCSVLTKSPLLLRDLPLMKEIRERGIPISANLSVPTLDEKAWRASEPHTPNPRARLEAVGELNRNGIPSGILIAPLMPGINDDPAQVERILELAAENGATGVSGIALHLRGEVRGIFMDWLRSYRPDLVERYEKLYARGAYAPPGERQRLGDLVRRGQRALPPPGDGDDDRYGTGGASRFPRRGPGSPSGPGETSREAGNRAKSAPPRAIPRQEALF